MPRLNYGTLLENIVALETVRSCFDTSADGVTFATSFAMPPLTQNWCKPYEIAANPQFSHDRLQQLLAGDRPAASLQHFWLACLANRAMLPTFAHQENISEVERYPTSGPNGALLTSMLATHLGRRLSLWLNDAGDRYGDPATAVADSKLSAPATVGYASTLLGASCFSAQLFPESIPGLETWLTQTSRMLPKARVGFLDPDSYEENGTAVSSGDHERWLRALANGTDRAISIMFFSCQNKGEGNAAISRRAAQFHHDSSDAYSESIIFWVSNFAVGVKFRWPEVKTMSDSIHRRVHSAWADWGDLPKLKTVFNGVWN